jgi:hypothetical protein
MLLYAGETKPEAGQKTNYGPGGYQAWSKQNEAGQRINKDSGPDSWQFWGPNRQLLNDQKPEAGQKTNYGPDGYQAWSKQNEAGQSANKNSGPNSWQFWGPNRQLLNDATKPEAGQKTNYGPDGYQAWAKQNEAGQRVQKDSGPDSWQFWGPNRQLLTTGVLLLVTLCAGSSYAG